MLCEPNTLGKRLKKRNTMLESAIRARGFNLGVRWAEARTISQYTSQEAAEKINIPPSRLSEIEHNGRAPTLDMLLRACKVFGCNADYLLGLTDDYDRDPIAATQRHVVSNMYARFQRLAEDVSEESYLLARSSPAMTGETARLAANAVDVRDRLQRLRDKCPQFDEDIPASALVSAIDEGAALAVKTIAAIEKFQRLMDERQKQKRIRHGMPTADLFSENSKTGGWS